MPTFKASKNRNVVGPSDGDTNGHAVMPAQMMPAPKYNDPMFDLITDTHERPLGERSLRSKLLAILRR